MWIVKHQVEYQGNIVSNAAYQRQCLLVKPEREPRKQCELSCAEYWGNNVSIEKKYKSKFIYIS